jgi:hypothetical protein
MKKVSFKPMVAVREIARLHPVLNESLWYRADDYKQFERMAKRKVLSMQPGPGTQFNGRDDFLSLNLGLECYTRQGSRKRSANRSDAYYVVLEEQELQSLEETDDPEELADIYMEFSKECQEEAYQLALELQRHVEEYVFPSKRIKVAK